MKKINIIEFGAAAFLIVLVALGDVDTISFFPYSAESGDSYPYSFWGYPSEVCSEDTYTAYSYMCERRTGEKLLVSFDLSGMSISSSEPIVGIVVYITKCCEYGQGKDGWVKLPIAGSDSEYNDDFWPVSLTKYMYGNWDDTWGVENLTWGDIETTNFVVEIVGGNYGPGLYEYLYIDCVELYICYGSDPL